MRILFMGTPEFAVPTLETIIKTDEVVAVITQPDKPQGRKMIEMPPPVKVTAIKHNIPVFQPQSLKNNEVANILVEYNPELIVVVAYGKILPEYILNYPKYGCINVHASLLPKYRGAGPIQWAVINGEKETGITTMYMEKGLDTGDMILKKKTQIREYETAGELHDRLKILGAEAMAETLTLIKEGRIVREKQDDSISSYAPMLNKEIAKINFNDDARKIINLIRGLNPWPVAYTYYKNKKLKIYSAVISGNSGLEPGFAKESEKGSLEIGCGDNQNIEVLELQLEGGRRMTAKEFLAGHPFKESTKLI